MLLLQDSSCKSNVRHIIYDLHDDPAAVRLRNLNLLFWISLAELKKHSWQKVLSRYGGCGDRDTLTRIRPFRSKTLFYFLLDIYNLLRMPVQILPIFRQAYFFRISDEQPRVQLLLQCGYMRADSRLRQVQLFCRLGKAPALGHLYKRFQLFQIH